ACTTTGTARFVRGYPRTARPPRSAPASAGSRPARPAARPPAPPARSRSPAGTARRRDGARLARWNAWLVRWRDSVVGAREHIRFEAEKRGDVFLCAAFRQARVMQQRHFDERQAHAQLRGHATADLEV